MTASVAPARNQRFLWRRRRNPIIATQPEPNSAKETGSGADVSGITPFTSPIEGASTVNPGGSSKPDDPVGRPKLWNPPVSAKPEATNKARTLVFVEMCKSRNNGTPVGNC